jgi:hypothetical protein
MDIINFCCKDISFFIENPDDPISYDCVLREFYIKTGNKRKSSYLRNVIMLVYCPWCGFKLPGNLRSQYSDVVSEYIGREIGVGEIWDGKAGSLPEEFKTDEWWKKRGL